MLKRTGLEVEVHDLLCISCSVIRILCDSALVPMQPGEKLVNYPVRPVDTNAEFEGTTNLQHQQVSAVAGGIQGPHMMTTRSVPRPMHMLNMQRMQQQGMAPYNLASQAGMGGGMNPSNMRGAPAQAHQQQMRRKDQGMGMTGFPPQQKRRY